MNVTKFGKVYQAGLDGVGYIQDNDGTWVSFYLSVDKVSQLAGKDGCDIVYTLNEFNKVIDVKLI